MFSSTTLKQTVTARAKGPGVHTQMVQRTVADLVAPLDEIVRKSHNLIAKHDATFQSDGENVVIPRYLFIGPKGGDDPIRIGIFAGIHGDEPEGCHALVRFLSLLEEQPELARGYCLFVYPVCNPTGYEDGTRHSRRGEDLNRHFWKNTKEPEVLLLQEIICQHAFHGIISLHTDDTSEGLYGFVRGATLTRNLLEPALEAAGRLLPRNQCQTIDGFPAKNGIIRSGYEGMLTAPPTQKPRPFEITFETPQAAPSFSKESALVVALQTILSGYRNMMAYAPNL